MVCVKDSQTFHTIPLIHSFNFVGKSPKEFLFLMAFVLPCSAIVVCYARIFYIVRRAERKASEPIKGTENEMKLEIDVMEDGESSQRINLNSKKRLADLRYIDTSVESDSPPTMLSLRESVNNNAVETCENNNVNEVGYSEVCI